ncbi:MAG: hypothetical protein PF692_10105 [Kiritimatiellae bacterium]|jgi:hypothetical protein|nr:hypothetical protein [Kiritimatiellia bacterium]
MNRETPEFTTEKLSNTPAGCAFAKWAGGIAAPMLPLLIAIICFKNQRGFIPGRHGGEGYELEGLQAIVLGVIFLAAAAGIHFKYFWGNSQRLYKYEYLGEVVTGIIAVAGIIYLIIFMFHETFYG